MAADIEEDGARRTEGKAGMLSPLTPHLPSNVEEEEEVDEEEEEEEEEENR